MLVSMGSGAGDIQPLAMIGKRLMQEGHSVRFGAHKKHQKIIEDSGVRYVSFDGFPPDEILSDAPDGTILKPLQQVDEKFYIYIKFLYNGETSETISVYSSLNYFVIDLVLKKNYKHISKLASTCKNKRQD